MLFNYTRSEFTHLYPQFRENAKEGLACFFDESGTLREIAYFAMSESLKTYVKYFSVKILDDQLVEHFRNTESSWVGAGGYAKVWNKDGDAFDETWRREEKLDQLIATLIECFDNAVTAI